MSSHKQRIEGATAAPMIHEPSKPSALVPKHGGAKTKVSPDLHHTTASLNASQLAIADAEDDQRSALHVLAALSSTDDMPAEDLCDIIRLTEGCLERLCRLLANDSTPVVAAACHLGLRTATNWKTAICAPAAQKAHKKPRST